MAIAPIHYQQQQAFSGGIDWSPLSNLGNVYREAQNRDRLSDLGKKLSTGEISYREAAGKVADMGDINSTLKFLALGEQQRKEGLARQAAAEFNSSVGGMLGGQPSAARTIAAPPEVAVNPTPGLVPNAAADEPPPPRRVAALPPEPDTGIIRTNPDGTIAGNLTAPAAPPVPAAAPGAPAPAAESAPSFDQRFAASRPSGVAPAQQTIAQASSQGPTLAHVPVLLRALTNPDLPEDQKGIAKELFKRALDDAKPPERIQFLNQLAAQSGFKGTPLELEMMLRKSGATNVNVGTEGQTAFAKEGGQVLAKRFGKISEEGESATADLAMLEQMRDLRQVIKTGGTAATQAWLAEHGIKVGKNVGAIEAYTSIVNKMTPTQRVPGSGTTSDFDAKMFKSGLTRLINTPEGNAIIDATLTGLAEHKVERARIAELALAGEIDVKEANRRFQALPNPYERFKAFAKAGFKPPAAAPAASDGWSVERVP
ncbi:MULTISPECIES: hypothetical protein [unclassified Bradyrhizobium]|uniref:hypothetical protein n=1 Tax=unclassified Bradyrhizobium TaxID=2631580 RepID=UPI002FF42C4C